MALFRADLVDGLLAEASINTIVGTNVFPIIFTFEDMLNSRANKNQFPRITVENLSREQEDNLSSHDGLYFATYQISLFHEVHVKALRSRVNSVVTKERDLIRTSLDALFEALEAYLKPLRSSVIGGHFVKKSHIANVTEEEFKIDKNRTILVDRVIYECSFSKT